MGCILTGAMGGVSIGLSFDRGSPLENFMKTKCRFRG